MLASTACDSQLTWNSTLGDAAAAAVAVVTLSRALYERVLRDLLVDRAEHAVELYEGSGSSWTCARCGIVFF